jgi:hypothetical protein
LKVRLDPNDLSRRVTESDRQRNPVDGVDERRVEGSAQELTVAAPNREQGNEQSDQLDARRPMARAEDTPCGLGDRVGARGNANEA